MKGECQIMGIIFTCDCCGKNMDSTDGPSYNLRDYETYINVETTIDKRLKKERCFKYVGCLCDECSSKFSEELIRLSTEYKLSRR